MSLNRYDFQDKLIFHSVPTLARMKITSLLGFIIKIFPIVMSVFLILMKD